MNGKIVLHDLVRAMGQKVACQECKEAGKPIHLWKQKDLYQLLVKNKVTVYLFLIFLS